ncbi:MAG: Hsp33 family molecular chaperone HslO [Castellaniella sp.]|uniref:Hsp33 family molecular chaperone HslO n=1 Tax=Castellaniella sp. TaxID=1955812 RepID=UPI002A35CC1A|nr:Hsp33 family molecular chaperone HslO [Castellaniella sp.]MDY0308936.1 Hsp33 family molecular chaperone HslO [Castellaniella sp.]
MSDTLKKYLTTDRSTRIQALHLTQAWQTGLAHQDLPPLLVSLLGELAAASVLLAGNIKFDGSVVLQLQGNGPVHLIMVECTSALDLRATAHLREGAALPADTTTLQDLLNADGQGRFMVMLDPAGRQAGTPAYQGIVPLEGDTIAAVLEHYMKHSEQLDTRLWLAADAHACAGLLLQRMPNESPATDDPRPFGHADTTWTHCTTLAGTLDRDELRATDSDTLIRRLFWEDDLLSFPAQDVRWHCPCSRERVASMLRTLGHRELEDILNEQGCVHITCNFCGQPYDFDAQDCTALFACAIDPSLAPGSDTVH